MQYFLFQKQPCPNKPNLKQANINMKCISHYFLFYFFYGSKYKNVKSNIQKIEINC